MADGDSTMTLEQLAKKVDDQSRFTRSVCVICTLAILGVNFYTLTEMFSNLPPAILLQMMGNMEKIVTEWNAIQNTKIKQGGGGITSPAPGGTPK